MSWHETPALFMADNKWGQGLATMGHARSDLLVERLISLHHMERHGDLMVDQYSGNAESSPSLCKKEAKVLFCIRTR